MAVRPVFSVCTDGVREEYIEFEWFPGFSPVQKQKSIESLHNNYLDENPDAKILEISSKSLNSLGIDLSAFNLKLNHGHQKIPVENIFQSSKEFENGGPYQDLLLTSPKEAKTDSRLKTSGNLLRFNYLKEWPLEPKTLFYDWIYLKALHDNPGLANQLLDYDTFTDIEYNPAKSFNCQARSAALYIYLYNLDTLDKAFNDPNYLRDNLKRIYGIEKITNSEQQSLFGEDY